MAKTTKKSKAPKFNPLVVYVVCNNKDSYGDLLDYVSLTRRKDGNTLYVDGVQSKSNHIESKYHEEELMS